MKVENHAINSDKSLGGGIINSIQEYLHEKAEGLSLIEKVMLTLYSMMTIFLLFSAVYFVLTKGFKY